MLLRVLLGLLALITVSTVQADSSAWEEWSFPNRKPAEFSVSSDGAISVQADSAVSLLYREVRDDEKDAHILSWRWRVDESPPPTDLTTPGEDDRALAVHVWFPPEDGAWSVMSTLSSLTGLPLPGQAITYIWGGEHPPQTLLVNPHLENGAMIILRDATSATGVWFEETVNIDADFTRAFSHRPVRRPYYILISADSDDTQSTIRAEIAGIHFSQSSLPSGAW